MAPVDHSIPNDPEGTPFESSSYSNVISIPRNNANPVNIYEMPYGEEQVFPWQFPEGKYGFKFIRTRKIAPSMYFRYRLFNKHGFWRKNMTYLLHAAVSYDSLLLKQQVKICMKMRKSVQNFDDIANFATTAADVRARNENPDISQKSYMFMKNIRGTVAYFRNALYNLLAMFRSLGLPTLFMTLSADDFHWPELGIILENLSYKDDVCKGSFAFSMGSDPLLTAIHFERRFSALFKFVICGESYPLGKVRDYFILTEFQNRGSPHYHIMFWIEDVPSFTEQTDNKDILEYVDKTIHSLCDHWKVLLAVTVKLCPEVVF